jgi:tritrans,polycis-undecaprenyl-diphosphate synthase [geranylgeranyl-diphosphate specific]
MDVVQEEPKPTVAPDVDFGKWLAINPHSVNHYATHPTLLHCVIIRSLRAQIAIRVYSQATATAICLAGAGLIVDIANALRQQLRCRLHTLRCNYYMNDIARRRGVGKKTVVIPTHSTHPLLNIWTTLYLILHVTVGCVMDGNRRFARWHKFSSVLVGHARGAATAAFLLVWWVDSVALCQAKELQQAPRVLTLWALSSDNLKRPKDELDGLLTLLTQELTALAYSPLIHHLRIRVRVIGSSAALTRFPESPRRAITELEHATATYNLDGSGLMLQLAIAYGGQDEVVEAVHRLSAQGEQVTAQALSRETYSARNGVPPISLILRTSERRTSGFMLWETQGAELYFADKLWPELNELDWLDAIRSFGKTEQRFGR